MLCRESPDEFGMELALPACDFAPLSPAAVAVAFAAEEDEHDDTNNDGDKEERRMGMMRIMIRIMLSGRSKRRNEEEDVTGAMAAGGITRQQAQPVRFVGEVLAPSLGLRAIAQPLLRAQ